MLIIENMLFTLYDFVFYRLGLALYSASQSEKTLNDCSTDENQYQINQS